MFVAAQPPQQSVRASQLTSTVILLTLRVATPPMPDLLGGTFSSLRTNVFDKFTRAAPPAVDTSAASKLTVTYLSYHPS